MTPAGDMYAVLHGGNPEHRLVKFNAPATVGGVASYEVVANFPSESTSKAVNFSSYVEINGDPYLAMSNNGKNTNDELYNVTTGVFSDWNIVNAGNAKDAVWAPLGITSGGVTYPMVGIDENSANSVLYDRLRQHGNACHHADRPERQLDVVEHIKGMGSWRSFGRELQRTILLLLP